MNILRKKMNIESAPSDDLRDTLALWRPLHVSASDALSNLTNDQWDPHHVEIDQGELEELLSALPDTGLAFALSNTAGSYGMYAHFPPQMAALVSTTALATPSTLEAGGADVYAPDMLDILLFKPMLGDIIKALSDLIAFMGPKRDSVSDVWRGLTWKDFSLPRSASAWTAVKLSLKRIDDIHANNKPTPDSESKDAPESIGEGENGVEANPSDTAEGNTEASDTSNPTSSTTHFHIFMPQSVTQYLIETYKRSVADRIANQDNPWAEQLYQVIQTAPVPLKAVIESCQMTVADCTRLQIGDVIDLPGTSLGEIGIETEINQTSELIANASLGVYKNFRALKLNQALSIEGPTGAQIIDL